MTSAYENDNEILGTIYGGTFFVQLSYHYLLKKETAPLLLLLLLSCDHCKGRTVHPTHDTQVSTEQQ
jgi:hypothetical protein